MDKVKKLAERIRKQVEEEHKAPVRVGIFGRAACGKTSLIRALISLNDPNAQSPETTSGNSSENGISEYRWGNFILSELPDFKVKKFNARDYLKKLRVKDYDAFICLTDEGFTSAESSLFREVSKSNKPNIFVRNKNDKFVDKEVKLAMQKRDVEAELYVQIGRRETVVFISCKDRFGLDDLNKRILELLPKDRRDRFLRSTSAHTKFILDQKREACRRHVVFAAAIGAGGNLFPAPGIGIAVEVSTISALLATIHHDFHLDAPITKFGIAMPHAAQSLALIQGAVDSQIAGPGGSMIARKFAAKWVIKHFGKRVVVTQAASFIPLFGQGLSASTTFLTIVSIGFYYIDECVKVVEKLLKEEQTDYWEAADPGN